MELHNPYADKFYIHHGNVIYGPQRVISVNLLFFLTTVHTKTQRIYAIAT